MAVDKLQNMQITSATWKVQKFAAENTQTKK